ncbi:Transposase IS4 [Popillia japonica]|uniref:Transposase IS4 n=1 Tax=Popillia japonica TaxID=7064 RepID=A0AAW1MDG7_POPJA
MFWERESDFHNSLVSNAITRAKFEYILSNFHIVENAALDYQDKFAKLRLDYQDKFAKLRHLFQYLNKKFIELAPHEQDHSVDEAMVPYYGHHGCKQYIHGKPIRYGYILWTGTTRLGYVLWCDPYQGASPEKTSTLGVGAAVLNYANVLEKRCPDSSFHLYFDNYFTSVPLLEELSKRKLFGTGTVRENRLPGKSLLDNKVKIIDSNVIAVKWNDNKNRGKSLLDNKVKIIDSNVIAVKWNDNKNSVLFVERSRRISYSFHKTIFKERQKNFLDFRSWRKIRCC